MDNELKNALKAVKLNTGIDVRVMPDLARINVQTQIEKSFPLPSKPDFSTVFCDTRQNKTYLKFYSKGIKYIGMLDGAGKTEKNYAYFIFQYLEGNLNREILLPQKDYLKKILLGECTNQQIQTYMRRFSLPKTPCYTMTVAAEPSKVTAVLNFLINYNVNGLDEALYIEGNFCAFIKFMDNNVGEQSSYEFANILAHSIFEETGIEVRLGIGKTCESLIDITTSFNQARDTLKLAERFHYKSKVNTYKEFVLIKILEELPVNKISEFLRILVDKDAKTIFVDKDLIKTGEEFLNNSLNISETSRKLFMHRNTLMYRLDKIERLTGLDIKQFPDAVNFKLITVLNKLL